MQNPPIKFNTKDIRFPPDQRTDRPLPNKEVENFCAMMADGSRSPDIAWYKLTEQMQMGRKQAENAANKLVETHEVIKNRILFLKGVHAVELADKYEFTREELTDILVDHLKSDRTHPRDIASLSRVMMDLMGWNIPQQVEIKSEIQHIMAGLNINAALPKEEAIEIQATPLS